jgi:hypothetical protein
MTEFQAYCKVSISPVRKEAKDQSEIVTQLLFGEVITVKEVNEPWANIQTLSDGYEGCIDFKHFQKLSDKEVRRWTEGLSNLKDRERTLSTPWGPQRICRGSFIPENSNEFTIGNDHFEFTDESTMAFTTPLEYAKDYLNTPYLWGGKTPFGIDCSGITQVIYRFFGINFPRDAFEQAEIGTDIDFEDIEAGDLAYFDKNGKITHVGILDGEGGIIHAAGHVRLDKITPEGIVHSTSNILTHKLTCIKRT